MADVETSTLVKAIIAIIVLVVMAFVVYSALNFDTVKGIAQEVFHVDTQEKINTKTEDSVSSFSSDLDACYKGSYNPDQNNNCFCFQKSHGNIQEGSYISIQKLGSTSRLTTLTENGAPISQYTKDYNLGLMVTSDSNNAYQLGCVFPNQFYIISDDNKWYIKWIDERLEFFFATDYTFGFYRDETSSVLAPAPMLYRIDSTHYCLITKLVDEPVEYSSSEFTALSIESNPLKRVGDDPRVFNEPTSIYSSSASKFNYYSLVQKFLLNEDLYCNKL